MARVYQETFDSDAGGWVADLSSRLPVWDGVAYCHGPWSIDANHAPPGAGYLHLLMYLRTTPWGGGGGSARSRNQPFCGRRIQHQPNQR
jgi:hypothetical protein